MKKLERHLSILSGVGITIGMIVGSGLFGLPGIVVDQAGIYNGLLGWIFIIFATMPMVYIFIKLGIKYPTSGGLSTYAKEAFGNWAKYSTIIILCGTYSIGIPALSIIGGSYLNHLVNLPEYFTYISAIFILTFASILNIFGIQLASWINKISVFSIFLIILYLTLYKTQYLYSGIDLLFNNNHNQFSISNILTASALIFWAFLGWENVSFGLEEFKNPAKSIPRVYWISFIVISIFYLFLALLTSGAIKYDIKVTGPSGVIALFGENIVIVKIAIVVIGLIILANAISWVFGASRLIYYAGTEKILPSYPAKLNNKKIPKNSLITLLVFYIIFILITYYYNIDISTIILLVSQNFLVLYLVSVIAFKKLFKSFIDRVFLALSLVFITILLLHFNIMLLYPIILSLLGYMVYRKREVS